MMQNKSAKTIELLQRFGGWNARRTCCLWTLTSGIVDVTHGQRVFHSLNSSFLAQN